MNRDLEPHVIAAWQAMARTVGALMKSLDEELQRTHGLTLSYFDVLEELTNAPGERVRMQQLADAVMLSRSGLTRLIDRMVTAGLVQREPFPTDRRGYYALATEEGKRLYLQARPVKAQAILQRFGSHLDYSDLLGLSSALRKVMVANDLLEPAPVRGNLHRVAVRGKSASSHARTLVWVRRYIAGPSPPAATSTPYLTS